jgi:ribosomal protein L3
MARALLARVSDQSSDGVARSPPSERRAVGSRGTEQATDVDPGTARAGRHGAASVGGGEHVFDS